MYGELPNYPENTSDEIIRMSTVHGLKKKLPHVDDAILINRRNLP